MPLNLDPMTKFAEGEMTDTVRITRDAEGYRDNTFSEITGTYTGPVRSNIYEGMGAVFPMNQSLADTVEGGALAMDSRYSAMLPLSAPEFEILVDEIEVLASLRDPQLVGKKFVVETVEATTFAAVRMLHCRLRVVGGNV